MPELPPDPSAPITVTLRDGSVMQQVVDLVVKKRPIGWSRKSYATYYKLPYALWIQRDIDAMLVDRQPRVYRLDLWPRVRMNALYQRINQAVRFLIEAENGLDPDGKYAKWRESVHIRREPGVGVVMEFDAVLEGAPKAEKFIGQTDKPKWKEKMDSWLDSDDIKPFHQAGLMLTPEEIEQIKLELPENIMYSITSREIKLVR